MDTWITNLEIRGIKSMDTKTYFDCNNVKYTKIEATDDKGDVHTIKLKFA